MSGLLTLINGIDDRLNPIVVKELRQSVQSRFITGVITFFLLIQATVLVIFVLTATQSDDSLTAGRNAYMWLHIIVLTTCLLILPLYTLGRLWSERSNTNMDLVFISAIKPGSIVWGKFWSSMLLACIIYSSCLPYMTVTFLLRGIDIPSILVILAMDFLAIAIAIQSSILIGSIPVQSFQVLGMLGYLVGLIWGLWILLLESSSMIQRGVGSTIDTNEFWIGSGFLVLLVCVGCVLEGGLAVSGLMPATANRALSPRIVFTGGWVLTGAAAVGVEWSLPIRVGSGELIDAWARCWVMVAIVGYVLACCERDEYGDRVVRSVPKSFGARLLMFLFSSGSAPGYCWSTMLLVGSVALMFIMHPLRLPAEFSSLDLDTVGRELGAAFNVSRLGTQLLICGAYTLCYTLTATLARWWFYRRWIKTTVNLAFALVLAAASVTLPYMISLYLMDETTRSRDYSDLSYLFLGSPVYVMNREHGNDAYLLMVFLFLSVWIALLCMAGVPWFAAQFRQFKRPPKVLKPAEPGSMAEVAKIPDPGASI